MNSPTMLTLDDIRRAQDRIRGRVHRTPLIYSNALSRRLGANVYLKVECLQKTGSFKPRGAFNKMLALSEEERRHGVVAASGGNHAQGVAFAAQQLGISATIVMPGDTPRNYVEATRGYGAEVVLLPNVALAFEEAERLQKQGRTMVHPFDDPLVAAGQGTIGLEILEDLAQVNRVYVSIGGGGLITGIATALRATNPDIRVIGVQTRGADAMAQSLAAHRLVALPAITSIARTLGAPQACELTFRHVRQLVEQVIVVDDAATVQALFFILERTKFLLEPASACCLVAADQQCGQWQPSDHVVLVACGGNVSVEDLCAFRQRFLAKT